MAILPRTTPSRCSPMVIRARAKSRAHPAPITKVSRAALEEICKSLALAIIEDGEGAQRTIEIEVRGAHSERAARRDRKNHRQFAAGEDSVRRCRPELGPHPRRRRTLRREIRSPAHRTFRLRAPPSAAAEPNILSTSATSTRRCSRSTSRSAWICARAKPPPASGPATSPSNTSTSIPATAPSLRSVEFSS